MIEGNKMIKIETFHLESKILKLSAIHDGYQVGNSYYGYVYDIMTNN